MPTIKTFLISALTAGCVLQSSGAVAFCSKPITPHCVEDGNLTDAYVPEERCRKALTDHVEDLSGYRNCLAAEIDRIDATVERFQKLLGGTGAKSRSRPALSGAGAAG